MFGAAHRRALQQPELRLLPAQRHQAVAGQLQGRASGFDGAIVGTNRPAKTEVPQVAWGEVYEGKKKLVIDVCHLAMK